MSWFAWEWGIPRHKASNAKISKLSAKWGSPSNSKKVFHHFFLLSLMAILLSPSISRLTTILSFSLNSSNSSESLASSYTKKIQSSGWRLFGLSIFRHIIYLHLYPWHWRRQWQPTPVLLPGKSHGQRSLVGCSPWGRYKSDTTERLHFHFSLSCIGEGNGNTLQCSCLENPRDGGAWWAAVSGVAQSQTRLKRLSSSSSSISTP